MSTNQRTLGKYELQQRLTSGYLKEGWKAFDTQQRSSVYLELLHIQPQTEQEFIPHFQRTMQPLLTLRHPNIVPVLDIQTAQDSLHNDAYIVSEYVEGSSLADYLQNTSRRGNFPSGPELVRLLTPIANALDYAHQQGIVHGVVKPQHILKDDRTPTEEQRLTGFGMYLLYNPRTLPLEDMYYIAPEVAQGYASTSRSDIYSLGVILYELCTGVVPFQDDMPSEVMMQHIHATPTSPSLINPQLMPAITAVIMRSLLKDPGARFTSATALVNALARAYNLPGRGSTSLPGTSSWDTIRQVSQPGLPMNTSGVLDSMNSPTYLTPRPQGFPGGTGAITPYVPPPFQQSQPLSAVHTPTPLPTIPAASPPPQRRTRRWLPIVLTLVLLAVIVVGAFSAYFLLLRPSTSTTNTAGKPVIGRAYLISSGLLGLKGTQGIADRLQVNLDTIPDPASGKNYYAWLLPDDDTKIEAQPLFLGTLKVDRGKANLSYQGTTNVNLLINYSRFLITEENANVTPISPSLDNTTHVFYAEFSQKNHALTPVVTYSLLDHLRHLLAQDPKLKAAGLTGGLDSGLFRNTQKILEWAGSARDALQHNDSAFARRQLLRILDYLDGSQFVAANQLPPDLQQPVIVDPTIARVALLEIDPLKQVPPGYLYHISSHLREIVKLPATTEMQRGFAIEINTAVDNVRQWLTAVHTDAVALLHLPPDQMIQHQATMNDLVQQANNAFVGEPDPTTGTIREGVAQIHYHIQHLATFEITACPNSQTANTCA